MQRIIRVLFCVSIIFIIFCASPSHSQIINGDFSDGLAGWYTSGDVSTSVDEVAILRTGGIEGPYVTSLSADFIISGETLTFRYYFDVTGPDNIKNPDFPSYGPDFFQMSLYAGDDIYYDIPLAWEPTNGFELFSLDVSSVAPGTMATVSFMLFDEDDAYLSIAAIDDLSDPPSSVPEPGTLLLLGGGLIGLFIWGKYRDKIPLNPPLLKGERRWVKGRVVISVIRVTLYIPVVFVAQVCSSSVVYGERLEATVDEMVRLEFTAPIFNTRTNILTLDMMITNISDTSVFTPLKIVVTGTSSLDVKVANPDGYTTEGLPFFDLSSDIYDKELSSEEKTPVRKISFYNPRRVKFRWDQDVIALVDVPSAGAPVIDSICLAAGEVSPLCEFYYIDIGVEDPDFIRFTQDPLPEMYKYEQVRVYAFDNDELPIRVTIDGVEAIYSEDGFYYRELILKEGINNISVLVTNDGGLSTNRDISLTIDSIPPAINVLEPASGSIVTKPDQVISGIIDDPSINNVMMIKDFITTEDIPVINGVFSGNVTLSPGHNDIRISVSDIAGNSAYYNLDIVYVYSEAGVITGRIYNSILGIPVAGVTVTAISGDDDSRTTISSEDGSFRLDGVRSGDLTIQAKKEGYSQRRLTIFSPGGDTPFQQDVGIIPVHTPDTFTLTGQVKDTGGSPLSGAKISVSGTPYAGISDNNGIYIISGIPRTSFVAEVSLNMYEGASLNINSSVYSNNTTILTYNFILKEVVNSIGIISPADGENVSVSNILVVGFVRSGVKDAGVRVNGVLARVYNGYFIANDIPLAEGVNRIFAEMITPSGTLLSDSTDVILLPGDKKVVAINAQEAGIVPIDLSVAIEEPYGTSFADYSLEVSGPGTAEVVSDGPLKPRVFISAPGIYTLKFNARDSNGNSYEGTFGFTGMTKGDVDNVLKQIWKELRDYLITNRIEDAISLFTPETKGRYSEQFLLLGDRLPGIFTSVGDIQLISLKDNMAKTRVYEGEITHYVWFSRNLYGQWKINKF